MKAKRIIITSLVVTFTSVLMAQKPPGVGVAGAISKSIQTLKKALENAFKYDSVPGDPFHTRVYTLPNGLKVYLSPYHVQPKIYTMIAVKAGSKYDPPHATGLAHYLEHMLFKGTDKYNTKNYESEKPLLDKIEELFELYRQTKEENQRKDIYRQIDSISSIAAKYAIANEYDKMASAIGARYTNAFTSNDETIYVNEIPSNQVDNWLDIEAERFRNPVFRLFHTELEAVYEEKNRTLDNDERQMYEAFFAELFPNHPYGTQTTIGTIEHLKNPSIREIKKYYEQYYVPNNMAIIMCGDFNPDTVIRKIFARFASKTPKDIPALNFVSPNISKRIAKTVYGPKSEMLLMGWKTDGAASKDRLYLSLISDILYNSKSGLIDKNVNGKQKVLKSYAGYLVMKDYCVFYLYGQPKENQTLEAVEKLFLKEIHKLQNGEFDEQLIKDILTNKKLELQQTLEDNMSRAHVLLYAFTKDIPLYQVVHEINELKKVTKADIMHFAKQYFRDDNYVVVYKKTGENKNIKVPKPPITPVELDRENTSVFAKQIMENKVKPIAPRFIDFKKDIQISTLMLPSGNTTRTVELLYNKNTENELFELTFYYHLNQENLKKYEVIFPYMNSFPATKTLNTEELFKKLYQLGCSINWTVSKSDAVAYLTVSGLSENMEQALILTEDILNNVKISKDVFEEYIKDLIKERENDKKNKGKILRLLNEYAVYGEKNIYNDVLNNDELQKFQNTEAEQLIKQLNAYPHQVLFYGPFEEDFIIGIVKKYHSLPAYSVAVSDPTVYSTEKLNIGNKIFYVPYPMQQAEFIVLNKVSDFDSKLMPFVEMFNNYFGVGMSGVVFQEIRESRALAYAAGSYISTPYNKKSPFISKSYVGTQADKLSESLSAIHFLLDSLPYNQSSFESAKESILQQIRTQRIIKTDIFYKYLWAKKFGLSYDIRKDVFEHVQKMTYKDLWLFHKKYMSKKPRNIAIIGDENKLDFDVLKQYGEIQKVSLKDIFGY